jgi:shikimate kinase
MDGTSRGIAIGGFMGAGKTTVGRQLAARLGLPFVDLDEVLERTHGPIRAQFEREGEAVFRARERALVGELCDGVPRVLATGGGTWADPENRRRLRLTYRTVVLQAPLDVLLARCAHGDRPLLVVARERYAERAAAYDDADRVLDVAHLGVDEVVEALCRW